MLVTELARWPRRSGAQLVLRRNELDGTTFFDLRTFNPDTAAGPGLPTDAGACLTAEEWAAVLPELSRQLEEAQT